MPGRIRCALFGACCNPKPHSSRNWCLLAVALPLGWFFSTSWRGYALLVGAILLLIMVEVLNTGIEAACDAVSREFHIDIQLAKDCGSLAVLISVVLAAIVWGLAIVETFTGLPL